MRNLKIGLGKVPIACLVAAFLATTLTILPAQAQIKASSAQISIEIQTASFGRLFTRTGYWYTHDTPVSIPLREAPPTKGDHIHNDAKVVWTLGSRAKVDVKTVESKTAGGEIVTACYYVLDFEPDGEVNHTDLMCFIEGKTTHLYGWKKIPGGTKAYLVVVTGSGPGKWKYVFEITAKE